MSAESEDPNKEFPHLQRGLYEFTRDGKTNSVAWVDHDGKVSPVDNGSAIDFWYAYHHGTVYRLGRVEAKFQGKRRNKWRTYPWVNDSYKRGSGR